MGNGSNTRTTGVLLAAGAGTRLGMGPKALLPYRGRPLVEAIADALLDGGCREVVVVLGARAADVSTTAHLDRFRTVVNPNWQSGMGSSYLLGAKSADPADHLLIALVDQPGLPTVRGGSPLLHTTTAAAPACSGAGTRCSSTSDSGTHWQRR
jgi:nicotine blue oxidoreductase